MTLQGMLYKKFVSKDVLKLSRGWHTRYFVLEGDRMEYFLTSRSTKRRGTVILPRLSSRFSRETA